MHSENLFTNYSQIENNAPLADKLRPKNLEDFFGQQSILNDNSRVIVRLSGTGTKGATLRLYFEKFFDSQQNLSLNPQIDLKPLINDLDALLNISKLTQLETPTVIT